MDTELASTEKRVHRCCECKQPVPDPYGHYYVPLYGQAGFYCHPCYQTVSETPDG